MSGAARVDDTTHRVLRFLARVVPSGSVRAASPLWDVRSAGPWHADQDGGDRRFLDAWDSLDGEPPALLRGAVARRRLDRTGRLVRGRVSHLTLVGSGVVLGRERTVCLPLVDHHVREFASPTVPDLSATPAAGRLQIDPEVVEAAAWTEPATGVISEELLASMPRLRTVVTELARGGTRVDVVASVHTQGAPVVGTPVEVPVDSLVLLVGPAGHSHDWNEPRLEQDVWDVRRSGPSRIPVVPVATPTRDSDRDREAWQKRVVLHGEDDPIGRVARVSLIGTGRVGDGVRPLLCPLLSAPAVPTGRLIGTGLDVGEPEPTVAAEHLGLDEALLEEAAEVPVEAPTPAGGVTEPPLRALLGALTAAGVHVDGVIGGPVGTVVDDHRLWLALGEVVHLEPDDGRGPTTAAGERLEAWADLDLSGTAVATLYDGVDPVRGEDSTTERGGRREPVRSPLPLTGDQTAALLHARAAPLSVVSGAPGTGKTHLAAAVALDTVARGGSVLVATRSAHAAESVAELLERHPGPPPLRFGGNRGRRRLADLLADGLPPAASRSERDAAADAEAAAAQRVARAREALAAVLSVADPDVAGGAAAEAVLRTDVPGAFDPAVDHTPALALLHHPGAGLATDAGLWTRLRGRWAERRLRDLLGAAPPVPVGDIADALGRARTRRIADQLTRAGGRLDPSGPRRELAEATTELRRAAGQRLDVETRGAATRAGRSAVGSLAAALRASPRRRAAQLARVDPDALTDALPLWVGTVAEVGRMLPRVAGLFDLVIVDEASQLDQPSAAAVLARAARAVVVGDPRQLRHVSFVADADTDTALAAEGVPQQLHGILDVRRVSTFDAAASVAPVRWLDDHLRSVPHLIGFSADRFYDTHLHVATAHPSTDTVDAVAVTHLDAPGGCRLDDGVVPAEIAAVCERVAELARQADPPSVGVVTPFRDQADAMESALADRFDLDEIRRLALRVGTVHGFQGGERAVVLLSVGLTCDGPPQRAVFVDDPHLFNVMVTRARTRIEVVTCLARDEASGLLAEYFAHAESPPRAPSTGQPEDRWTAALHAELVRNELTVEGPRTVGRHVVHLTVHGQEGPVGLLTRPHPDGFDADVERYDALARAGWDVVEVYATPTDDDPVRAALELHHRLASASV